MIKKLLVILVLLLPTTALAETQLIMMHHPGCPYCNNFLSEVRGDYIKSKYNEVLPLIIMNITEPKTGWWIKTHLSTPIRGTPTFIIWDVEQNKELDRIIGYANKKYFFFVLDKIIEMRKLKNSSI